MKNKLSPMEQDDLERQARELTQMMTGHEMERVSTASAMLEAITKGDVFLTFAKAQWVATRISDDRVFFFNPDHSTLPVGSVVPADDLPQRRVEEEGEQSVESSILSVWFDDDRVRALRVI